MQIHPRARDGDASHPTAEGTVNAPVSFIAAKFGPDANFEGRVVAELQRFEDSGMMRVLDVLFVRRVPETGELDTRQGIPGRPTLVSQADVDEVAGALEPGHAAGLLLIEHVWQRELAQAIGATGGEILQEGLLDPEQAAALSR
jgi:Family of unknown function (DUF6325)